MGPATGGPGGGVQSPRGAGGFAAEEVVVGIGFFSLDGYSFRPAWRYPQGERGGRRENPRSLVRAAWAGLRSGVWATDVFSGRRGGPGVPGLTDVAWSPDSSRVDLIPKAGCAAGTRGAVPKLRKTMRFLRVEGELVRRAGLQPADGVAKKFRRGFEIELGLDVGAVNLDGFGADVEMFGHLQSAQALAD